MHMDWTRTGNALFANVPGREYIIIRRDTVKGIKYLAWCDMRGGIFAERGPVHWKDTDGRAAALDSLKEACAGDAEAGGVALANWGVET